MPSKTVFVLISTLFLYFQLLAASVASLEPNGITLRALQQQQFTLDGPSQDVTWSVQPFGAGTIHFDRAIYGSKCHHWLDAGTHIRPTRRQRLAISEYGVLGCHCTVGGFESKYNLDFGPIGSKSDSNPCSDPSHISDFGPIGSKSNSKPHSTPTHISDF
jgi:hypothetical protein